MESFSLVSIDKMNGGIFLQELQESCVNHTLLEFFCKSFCKSLQELSCDKGL